MHSSRCFCHFFVRWIYPSSLRVISESISPESSSMYGSYAFSIRHCWMGDGYSVRPAKSVSMLSMVVIRLELCTSRVPAATTTSSSSHSSAKSRVVWYSGAGLAQAVLEYRKCCCLCEKAANILVIAVFFPSRYFMLFPFSALTLSVGRQKGHPACKILGVVLLLVTIWLELCTS